MDIKIKVNNKLHKRSKRDFRETMSLWPLHFISEEHHYMTVGLFSFLLIVTILEFKLS
jgi:hypothetical protein